MSDLRPTSDDGVRVGDGERRAVDERLRDAVGEGLLSLGEYDERAASVWAARTRGELRVLTADLPPATTGAAVAVRPRSRHRRRWCWGLAAVGLVGFLVLPVGTEQTAGVGGFEVVTVEGGLDDLTLFVRPGQDVFDVPADVEDVTVVVPDGVRAVPEVLGRTGEVECEQACSVVSEQSVRIVVPEGAGEVEVETASEHD